MRAAGQGRGLAAGAALDAKVGVQDLPYPVLRERLIAAKQVLAP